MSPCSMHSLCSTAPRTHRVRWPDVVCYNDSRSSCTSRCAQFLAEILIQTPFASSTTLTGLTLPMPRSPNGQMGIQVVALDEFGTSGYSDIYWVPVSLPTVTDIVATVPVDSIPFRNDTALGESQIRRITGLLGHSCAHCCELQDLLSCSLKTSWHGKL